MNYILFIDTETTGLPPKIWNSYNDPQWDSCKMIQIAWELWNPIDNTMISAECFTIKPNFIISPESTAIHGITQDCANETGVKLFKIWRKLEEILPNVATIVAHNIGFDNKIILSELFRSREYELFNQWRNINKKCTMIMGTEPGKKWPKLAELYEKLFEEKPNCRLHSADADVYLCSKIYFKLLNKI